MELFNTVFDITDSLFRNWKKLKSLGKFFYIVIDKYSRKYIRAYSWKKWKLLVVVVH